MGWFKVKHLYDLNDLVWLEIGRNTQFTKEFERTKARAEVLNQMINDFEFENGLIEFDDESF